MSATVIGQALLNSRAEGNDRNVLLALADAAGHDGVTWLTIGLGKDDTERTICRLARVSKSTAVRAVAFLRDELGELQTVRVRRGRSFVTVYRVLHGAQEVDYSRIPFDLPYRFDEEPSIHGVKLTPSTRRADGVNLTPSSQSLHGVIREGSRCQIERVHGVKRDDFTVSSPRAHEREGEPLGEPAAGTVREPEAETVKDPAAEEGSATDREITEIVRGLRGADIDSPRRIRPLAIGLPRSVFMEVIETVKRRHAANPCGLLTTLLRIACAERTSMLSERLNAELAVNARPAARAITTVDALKADQPERYVRMLAKALSPAEMREALTDSVDTATLDQLLDLHLAVRRGAERSDRIGTPEQERRRWIEVKLADPDFPIDEIHIVIDSWDRVDDIERAELHDLADHRRSRPNDEEVRAA